MGARRPNPLPPRFCVGLLLLLTLTLEALAQGVQAGTVTYNATSSLPSLLLFTHTAGYRHAAIPYAVDVITSLGQGTAQGDTPSSLWTSAVDPRALSARWRTEHVDDPAFFDSVDPAALQAYAAITFAYVTDADPPAVGPALSDLGAGKLLRYVAAGGNFVGLHSATNALYAHAGYGRLVGAFFSYHAAAQGVSVRAVGPEGAAHPASAPLAARGTAWDITEEMYHLRTDPRGLPSPARVLLSNASGYADPGGLQGEGTPQPLAWYREGGLLDSPAAGKKLGGDLDGETQYEGGSGRCFVTTLGHENATWEDPFFVGHVLGGIAWAMNGSTSSSPANASDTISHTGYGSGSASTSTSSSSSSASASASAGSGALRPPRADMLLLAAALIPAAVVWTL